METRFDEIITSRVRLREVIQEPSRKVSHKVIDHIDDICARFIAASPFVVVATRGLENRLDLSPKGDPAGFVAVLDANTLAIPDRLGNNRVDSFENLLVHPQIGLIFMIPGVGDTLRVRGKARLVRDKALQERLAVAGKAPNLVLVVTVEAAFMHCPKCIVRSHLWSPAHWPDTRKVPSLAEAMVAHGALDDSVPQMQAIIDHDGRQRLY
ncbi:pyridoxamine 5'-phosphate oxidase family protein [Halomonas sp. M4R5S39]|uniref:MSMEG_1061 family FMN-dependent PPOX-type flavoprotein n=1 Tax=Halomonas kalidii TaxID=3043293 RepID=UPI0024A8A643|nr:MSMEG_1061 family FMN-dependent PPOX-type flavoprotein [Halomonas kalidii]MDI5986610.1 pyridoxamine 5'-phosphate oxidase family protein [Halomonas kalidii]